MEVLACIRPDFFSLGPLWIEAVFLPINVGKLKTRLTVSFLKKRRKEARAKVQKKKTFLTKVTGYFSGYLYLMSTLAGAHFLARQ